MFTGKLPEPGCVTHASASGSGVHSGAPASVSAVKKSAKMFANCTDNQCWGQNVTKQRVKVICLFSQ